MDIVSDLAQTVVDSAVSAAMETVINKCFEYVEMYFPQLEVKRNIHFLEVCEKTSKELIRRGYAPENCRKIMDKRGLVFIPIACVESEPTLQELLAQLLANAMDPKHDENQVHVAFIECVKTMTRDDAMILKFCAEKGGSRFNKAEARSRAGLKDDIERFEIALGNLKRLQIITTMKNSVSLEIVEDIEIDDSQHFSLTSFGKAFIEASRP